MRKPERKFVIFCRSNSYLYWSNDLGWTALEEATLFDECEMPHLSPPIDGAWREVTAREQRQYWPKAS